MQVSIGADLELKRRLEAFARVRLGPTEDARARMRARVMRDARIAMAAGANLATIPATDMAGLRTRARLVRRGAGVLLAAGLTLGMAVGALAAAQPGGPLYPTRMWLETITLPADGAARSDANILRLESRMQEILAAAASGDRAAVAAALAAYQAIADEALLAATGDAPAIERLRAALDRHVAVLASVAAQVPPHARDAIERNIDRAIERNGETIDRINGKPAGPAAQPVPAAKPEKTVEPTSEPEPAATPAAHPTQAAPPTPSATDQPKGPPSAKPDRTPPAHGRSQAP